MLDGDRYFYQFDTSKLDGTPRKTTDIKKLSSLDWKFSISLLGIKNTYKWYSEQETK